MEVPRDFDDLETIKSWSFVAGNIFLIERSSVPGVLRSHAASIRQVNAAYKVAASSFSKKWMALHDRAIKRKLREMAEQVHGNFSGLVQAATETPKSLDRDDNKINGMLMLRPVLLKRKRGETTEYFFYPSVEDEERQRLVLDERNFFEVTLDLPQIEGSEPQPIVRAHDGFGVDIDLSNLERFVPGAQQGAVQPNRENGDGTGLQATQGEFVNSAHIHTRAGIESSTEEDDNEGSSSIGEVSSPSNEQTNEGDDDSSWEALSIHGSQDSPQLLRGGQQTVVIRHIFESAATSRDAGGNRGSTQSSRRGGSSPGTQTSLSGRQRSGQTGRRRGPNPSGNGTLVQPAELSSIYTLLKGYAGQTGGMNRYLPTELSAAVWEGMMHNEWSTDLPARETMQIKGYLAHARDSTTFAALRLDLIGDEIQQHLADFYGEGDYGDVDFDHFPFPFEERMHREDLKATTKKLNTLARWLTLCLYDTEQVPLGPIRARPADSQPAGNEPAGNETADDETADGETADRVFQVEEARVSIASHRFWEKILDNDSRGLSMDQSPNILDLFDAPFKSLRTLLSTPSAGIFYNSCKEQIRNYFSEQLILNSSESQVDTTIVPYVMPFIDFTTKDGFVWGSTITPFLLAVNAAPTLLSMFLGPEEVEEREEPQRIELTAAQVEDLRQEYSRYEQERDRSTVDERRRFYRSTYATRNENLDSPANQLCDMFWQRFKGMHFSNRKALNNGVYAVMFPQSYWFQQNFVMTARSSLDEEETTPPRTSSEESSSAQAEAELAITSSEESSSAEEEAELAITSSEPTASPAGRPDLRTNLLVRVHGRFPVQKTDATLLGCLLSLLVELGTTQFETARRMADLVTPYNVMVRGPSEGALSTAMQLGEYWYFTSVMLALENEACQLLGHIARDNRKRKREAHWVVSDIFLQSGVTDFYILQTRLEAHALPARQRFSYHEFAAALVRLVRAIKSFNDCMNDAGRTMRDRVVMGRIDGERMVASHEVLYGNWVTRQ